jgi:exosortase H (IPTLxxWG-CTERM-specific)
MGYSPNKKSLKKKPQGPSFLSKIRSGWLQKWPVLFFVLGFAVLMILFYIFWLSDFYLNHVQPNIVSVNATVSSFILNLFGMHTVAVKENITSSAFSVCIANGCDAVEAMALFSSALLSFPAKWKYKLVGFFVGIAVMMSLNIIRIVSLFFTGIYFPKAFELMHVEVWQVLFILIAIGLWIFWIKWTRKETPHAAK